MEENVHKAVKVFFSNSSFEMIYNVSLAKALDAEANEFPLKYLCQIRVNCKIFNLLHLMYTGGTKMGTTKKGCW